MSDPTPPHDSEARSPPAPHVDQITSGGGAVALGGEVHDERVSNQVASGGVANSGTMGNVQTGSGTQYNIPRIQAGTVYVGSNVYHAARPHPHFGGRDADLIALAGARGQLGAGAAAGSGG
ncbi:MAG TPA: hypothetical protein VM536_10215 [Chloroflexia bacterium]|nr:hypothetical protein [Chloroflexia bacterium]